MENNYPNSPTGYKKSNIGKWILIYLIIAAVVYGVIYYFMAISGGYNYNPQQYPEGYNPQTNDQIPANQNSAAITSDKDLQSASADLDASNIGQIDTGLNQNDEDASTF